MWLFEHLVAHISLSIVPPFIVWLSYTQIQYIKEFKPPLSLKPSTFIGSVRFVEITSQNTILTDLL